MKNILKSRFLVSTIVLAVISLSIVFAGDVIVQQGNVDAEGDLVAGGDLIINTDNLVVDTNTGNVGIGTENPGAKLHIAESGISQSWIDVYSITDSIMPEIHLRKSGNGVIGTKTQTVDGEALGAVVFRGVRIGGDFSNGGIIRVSQSGAAGINGIYGDMYLETYNASAKNNNQLVLSSDGNVGIGTASPGGKLDVNGTIYQRGGSLHADYVFENDYNLESIEKHSTFMWSNKHLPAIPKATVDENGNEIVEIGSHRKGIVEELEKAHIYIEQLNNQNKELKARLEKLENIMMNDQKGKSF